ncbi:hypothetical protein [Streptomyces sp. ATCC 21386]|nr:hypothetical protein [Streptomyces sp. ATCC 21386]
MNQRLVILRSRVWSGASLPSMVWWIGAAGPKSSRSTLRVGLRISRATSS